MNDGLGKKAEQKIKEWLNRPSDGYDFQRIPDQMSGLYGSSNICDFIVYKYPEHYYIESKSTWNSRFEFSMLTTTQYNGLVAKSKIAHVNGLVMILFASHKRAFILDIKQIAALIESGKMSINIDKIDTWTFAYGEVPTVPNNRKMLLDYTGDFVRIWEAANYDNRNI